MNKLSENRYGIVGVIVDKMNVSVGQVRLILFMSKTRIDPMTVPYSSKI